MSLYSSSGLQENKCHFAVFCIQNNLTHMRPPVYVIRDKRKSYLANTEPVFPSVFKPGHGTGGYGIHVLHNSRDYMRSVKKVGSNTPFVVEKYIDSPTEYTSNMAVHKGKIIYENTMVGKFKPFTIRNGAMDECNRQHSFLPERHRDSLETLFACADEYTGMACMDYKIVDDRMYVFEINPRFGASTTHGTVQRDMQMALDLCNE